MFILLSQEKRKTTFGDAAAFAYQIPTTGMVGIKDNGIMIIPERYLQPEGTEFPTMAIYWGKQRSKAGQDYNNFSHIHSAMIQGDVSRFAKSVSHLALKELEKMFKIPTLSAFEPLTIFILTKLFFHKTTSIENEVETTKEIPMALYELMDRGTRTIMRRGLIFLPERVSTDLQKRIPCVMLYKGMTECRARPEQSYHDIFFMSPSENKNGEKGPSSLITKKRKGEDATHRKSKDESLSRKPSTTAIKVQSKVLKVKYPKVMDMNEETQGYPISDDDDVSYMDGIMSPPKKIR